MLLLLFFIGGSGCWFLGTVFIGNLIIFLFLLFGLFLPLLPILCQSLPPLFEVILGVKILAADNKQHHQHDHQAQYTRDDQEVPQTDARHVIRYFGLQLNCHAPWRVVLRSEDVGEVDGRLETGMLLRQRNQVDTVAIVHWKHIGGIYGQVLCLSCSFHYGVLTGMCCDTCLASDNQFQKQIPLHYVGVHCFEGSQVHLELPVADVVLVVRHQLMHRH